MNKMFKKIFAVVAACATVATMSVSAFAAEEAAHEAGSVSVTGYAAVEGATQYTVMVFEDSFTGTEVDKIFYINQGSDPAALLGEMLVKGGELAVGDYTVRIGNDKGTTVDVDLKVVAEEEEITFYFGDVNGSGGFPDLDDAMEIIKYYMWEESVFDDGAEWRLELANVTADRDTNDSVDLDDAIEIIKYYMWEESTLDSLLPAE